MSKIVDCALAWHANQDNVRCSCPRRRHKLFERDNVGVEPIMVTDPIKRIFRRDPCRMVTDKATIDVVITCILSKQTQHVSGNENVSPPPCEQKRWTTTSIGTSRVTHTVRKSSMDAYDEIQDIWRLLAATNPSGKLSNARTDANYLKRRAYLGQKFWWSPIRVAVCLAQSSVTLER